MKKIWLIIAFLSVTLVAADCVEYHPNLISKIEQAAKDQVTVLNLGNICPECSHGLTHVPAKIGDIKTLKVLNLSGNQLSSSSLARLINHLSNNGIALEELNLDGNLLVTLPPEIGQLSSLKKLSLNRNMLTALPPEFRQLSNLEMLNLSMNRFRQYPPEINAIAGLNTLDLGDNQLKSLPPEIDQLTQLRNLYLAQNELGVRLSVGASLGVVLSKELPIRAALGPELSVGTARVLASVSVSCHRCLYRCRSHINVVTVDCPAPNRLRRTWYRLVWATKPNYWHPVF